MAAVDHHHLPGLALNVQKNLTCAVIHRELRLVGYRQSGDDGKARRIEDGHVLALAIEGEHMFTGGFVQDCVGIVAGNRSFLDDLQGGKIEHRDRVAPAIAGIAAVRPLVERDSVHALSVRNRPDDLSRLGIHHVDMIRAAQEEALARRVERHIVPAADTAQLPALHHRPVLGG